MVTTKKALITSLISALIIGGIYWLLQLIISNIPAWLVALVIFIIAFLGMKSGDIFK